MSTQLLSPAKEKSGWPYVLIGNALNLINGRAFKPTEWSKSGLPIIRIQNLNNPEALFNYYTGDLPEKFSVEEGDLLFAWSGTPGTSFGAHIWQGTKAWLNQHIFKVEFDKKQFNKRFLQLAINQNLAEYIRAAHGAAGLAHITKGRFESSELPVPPLTEQCEIVGEIEKQFTRLEAGVRALHRVQANLKRYRASVLKAACEGRLVATEAELARAEGRSYEPADQLLALILTERRQKWSGRGKYNEPAAPDTDNLQPLPEGWAFATVEQLSVLVQYGTSAKTNESATGIPVLRMGNIQIGALAVETLKYLPKDHDEFPELHLKKGDLLFNRTNSAELVGKTAVFRGVPELCSFASYLIRVRLCGGCLPDVLAYFINSVFGRAWIARVVNQQVGQANVNGTKLQALTIPLPPFAEQKRIVAEVERRLSVIDQLEALVTANLQRASRLRQSILQKAFAGELIVSEAAEIPVPKITLAPVSKSKRHFARAVLSAEIVHRLHAEPTFGRIKHQKIFHLCEHIAQLDEIDGQYHREAAGPLDNKLIYANESELKKQKWYAKTKREPYGHCYQSLEKAGGHQKYLEGYWPDKMAIIHKLIELMRSWNTERCEIFSTTYAAWNDLLLLGREATDDTIIHEVLHCWHDSKRRIPEDRWRKAIAWMKKEKFTPTAFGKQTHKLH